MVATSDLQWFHEYSHDVHHFLCYYTGRRDVADMLWNVFATAHRQYGSPRKQKSQYEHIHPKLTIIALARRLVQRQHRQQRLMRFIPRGLLRSKYRAMDTHPGQPLVLDEPFASLYRALAAVGPLYRDVLILRSIMDLTELETAEVLDWSVDRVHVMMQRALLELGTSVRDLELEQEGIANHAVDR